MAVILKTKSIYFNDVNLIPQPGVVSSRKQVNCELHRIIVSPMLSVVGEKFVESAAKEGLSITTPRFITPQQKVNLFRIFQANKINHDQLFFISLGFYEKPEDLEYIHNATEYHDSYLLDVANGYVPQIKECVENIGTKLKINNLMIGNIVTGLGVHILTDRLSALYHKLFIRIGIANGGVCATSDETGINRGQITELIECNTAKNTYPNVYLASDGGISKPGFALKAFGAGADYCLMGGYFSKALEAETNVNGDGTYFGCASEKQNKLANLDKHSEGKTHEVDKTTLKPLSEIIKQLKGGISSGISYCGYQNISDFINNGEFEVKQNSLPPKKRY